MAVRKILSARMARPRVERMLEALVEAAVFIGRADGQFGEQELEVFIDSMREVVSAAVGEEFLESLASTTRLLDQTRGARSRLITEGRPAFLAQLAPKFHGEFARDGLVLAYRVVLADGHVTDGEAQAFADLAGALGVEVVETEVLKDLAAKWDAASGTAPDAEVVQAVVSLEARGWKRFEAEGFDAAVEHLQPEGSRLRLELDAREHVLHVHMLDAVGAGPRLVCLFLETPEGLLTVLDALKESLTASTLQSKLPALKAVSPELFVEQNGKFSS